VIDWNFVCRFVVSGYSGLVGLQGNHGDFLVRFCKGSTGLLDGLW
jgi:hypothetical protein